MAQILLTATNSINTPGISTVTFSAQSIGEEADDRVIVLAVAHEDNAGGANEFTSITVGGVLVSETVQDDISGFHAEIHHVHGVTGTTADVVLTSNSPQARIGIAIYRIVGAYEPNAIYTDHTDGSGGSVSLTNFFVGSNGVAVFAWINDGSSTAVTWTNAIEDFDAAVGVDRISFAHSTQSGTYTVTADGATAQQSIAGASWVEANVVTEDVFHVGQEVNILTRTRMIGY